MSAHRRTDGNASKTVYPPVSLHSLGGYNKKFKICVAQAVTESLALYGVTVQVHNMQPGKVYSGMHRIGDTATPWGLRDPYRGVQTFPGVGGNLYLRGCILGCIGMLPLTYTWATHKSLQRCLTWCRTVYNWNARAFCYWPVRLYVCISQVKYDSLQLYSMIIYFCDYYYNRFMALWTLSGTTRVSRYQKGKIRKVKPIWIYWSKQEIVSGSSISQTICKAAPHPRQITMSEFHHSIFLQAGCPSCHPTNSVKPLKCYVEKILYFSVVMMGRLSCQKDHLCLCLFTLSINMLYIF